MKGVLKKRRIRHDRQQSDNSIMTAQDCQTDNDTIPKLFGNMSYDTKNLTANQTKDGT